MASEAIVDALDAMYEAAITPEAWSDALHRFARATGSVGCLFYPHRPELTDLRFPASPDIRDFLSEFVEGGWYLIDHRSTRGWPLAQSGRSVVIEHDIASDDERRRSPYYQELLKRHGMPWWAAFGFRVDGVFWSIPVLRSARQGAFTPADALDLAGATKTLAKVVSLAGKFALAQGRSSIEALERVGCASLVLDFSGRSVLMNALAQSMLGGDLRLINSRLYAVERESNRRLQRLIDHAVAPLTRGSPPPGPVFVARREGRPYMVEAMPATVPMRDLLRRIAALLVITDLGARPRLGESLIREAFGLTATEARLAISLGSGEDLRAAAEIHGIAYETARRHLKAIFSKAQIKSQSELVALLMRLPSVRERDAAIGR
jgi:DNA-binding CsgD family transcriptional regulator